MTLPLSPLHHATLGALECEIFQHEQEVALIAQVLEALNQKGSQLEVARRRRLNAERCVLSRIPDELLSMVFKEARAGCQSSNKVLAATCHR